MRKVRNIIFSSLTIVTVFFAGVAIACDGNYQETLDTLDCISLDLYSTSNACKQIGGSERRCFSCSQEQFLCFEGDDMVPRSGPTFNCGTPGPVCQ